MGSLRGVQQHQVNAAADALLADRARPTVERVRMKIGRGSPNTVAPMLEAWFADLAPRLGLGAQEEGAGVPARVRQAMDTLWDTARELASGEAQSALARELEGLDTQRSALVLERAELARQAAASGERESLLREAADRLRNQIEDLSARLSVAGSALHERDGALVEARGSIATLVQQTDAAARAHARAVEGFTKERERLEERMAVRERRLLEEVDRARQESRLASRALTVLESRSASERAELERSKQNLSKALEELRVDNARLQERVAARQQTVRKREAVTTATQKNVPPRTRKRIASR